MNGLYYIFLNIQVRGVAWQSIRGMMGVVSKDPNPFIGQCLLLLCVHWTFVVPELTEALNELSLWNQQLPGSYYITSTTLCLLPNPCESSMTMSSSNGSTHPEFSFHLICFISHCRSANTKEAVCCESGRLRDYLNLNLWCFTVHLRGSKLMLTQSLALLLLSLIRACT